VKVKITRIVFEGATLLREDAAQGDQDEEERLIAAAGRRDAHRGGPRALAGYYRDHGYRDARVIGHELNRATRRDT